MKGPAAIVVFLTGVARAMCWAPWDRCAGYRTSRAPSGRHRAQGCELFSSTLCPGPSQPLGARGTPTPTQSWNPDSCPTLPMGGAQGRRPLTWAVPIGGEREASSTGVDMGGDSQHNGGHCPSSASFLGT